MAIASASFEFNDYTLYLRFFTRGKPSLASDGQPMQYVQLRVRNSTELLSRSSHLLLQQTPPTLVGDGLFSLPLRELHDPPFLSHYFINAFISSFNHPPAISDLIFRHTISAALRLAAGELDRNFHIIVAVDFIHTQYLEDSPPPKKGASASAIERLEKQQFDGSHGLQENGGCTICLEDDTEIEAAIIPCGHVYHKSCILQWLKLTNSCPLCRRELQD